MRIYARFVQRITSVSVCVREITRVKELLNNGGSKVSRFLRRKTRAIKAKRPPETPCGYVGKSFGSIVILWSKKNSAPELAIHARRIN